MRVETMSSRPGSEPELDRSVFVAEGPRSPDERDSSAVVPPLIQQAHEAFRRDLHQLLEEHEGQWVAYQGAERIGVAATKTELHQECLCKGLKRGEFLVRSIEPEPGELVVGLEIPEAGSAGQEG